MPSTSKSFISKEFLAATCLKPFLIFPIHPICSVPSTDILNQVPVTVLISSLTDPPGTPVALSSPLIVLSEICVPLLKITFYNSL